MTRQSRAILNELTSLQEISNGVSILAVSTSYCGACNQISLLYSISSLPIRGHGIFSLNNRETLSCSKDELRLNALHVTMHHLFFWNSNLKHSCNFKWLFVVNPFFGWWHMPALYFQLYKTISLKCRDIIRKFRHISLSRAETFFYSASTRHLVMVDQVCKLKTARIAWSA